MRPVSSSRRSNVGPCSCAPWRPRLREPVNRAAVVSLTLFALALVVMAFTATWLTIPTGRLETHNLATGEWENRIAYPAKLFRVGLRERSEPQEPTGGAVPVDSAVRLTVDLDAMKERVLVFYAGLAAVVLLLGGAFGVRALHY